jgi:DNA-binding NtrC family response regulator
MTEEITALLVSAGDETFEKLELALDRQGIRAYRALSSAQVLALLEQPDCPQMIFTDTTVPDGTWADIVDLAAPHSVPVVLVSRLPDLDLYIQFNAWSLVPSTSLCLPL